MKEVFTNKNYDPLIKIIAKAIILGIKNTSYKRIFLPATLIPI